MKSKNTNRTVLIVLEALLSLSVLLVCLMSINRETLADFSPVAAHTVLVFIFSLVYSSSEAFMATDRLFVKRFALSSIAADLLNILCHPASILYIDIYDAFRTKIIIFLFLIRLVNLLGSVVFYKRYTNRSVRNYKVFSTLICLILAYITPYAGSLNGTLSSLMVAVPALAVAASLLFGCVAQITAAEQEAAPLRNLGLIFILASEFLQFISKRIFATTVLPALLFAALVWVIIVEQVNARRIR